MEIMRRRKGEKNYRTSWFMQIFKMLFLSFLVLEYCMWNKLNEFPYL
jgi:hypothetical protein